VVKMLGLYQPPESLWLFDNQTLSVDGTVFPPPDPVKGSKTLTPGPDQFALWVKQNVVAGRPVIVATRTRGNYWADYDHIIPFYGMCYNSLSQLEDTDQFIMTDNYGSRLAHTPADPTFYAAFKQCNYTGCIMNDYWNLGVAVGPLEAPPGLYYPVKIVIDGWSDTTAANGEPGASSNTNAVAKYTLTISGLTPHVSYKVYRTTGLFDNYQIPQSADALGQACTLQGVAKCKTATFTAKADTVQFFSLRKYGAYLPLGSFSPSGITYFLVVRTSR